MQIAEGTRVFYKATINTDSALLDVRSGPSMSNSIVFRLPNGATVDVMFECNNGWVLIDEDGDQGYVKAAFLAKVNTVPDPVRSAKSETTLMRADGFIITLKGDWKIV